jgi:hypothetical protein
MANIKRLNVKGLEINIFHSEIDHYISLIDIARHKETSSTDDNKKLAAE